MAAVWKYSRATSPAELLVLLALADWADEYGYSYPSQPAIAQKARVSERQVQRVLRKFAACGELETQLGGHTVSAPGHRPGRTGLQRRNHYRLTCVPDEQRGDTVASLRVPPRDDRPPPLRPGKGTTRTTEKGRQDRRERGDMGDAPVRKIRQEDPSACDPSDVQAGALPRRTPYREEPTGDTPDDNVGVITKLAHLAIDELGPDHPDLTETVKSLCGFHKIRPYDSAAVCKAIKSAIWQRSHQERQG